MDNDTLSNTALFSVTPPEQWQDRSMLVWSAPATANNPAPPNVLVTQDYPPKDMSLTAYVSAQVRHLLNTEQDIEIDQQIEREWHGKPAVELTLVKPQGDLLVKQRQVYVIAASGQALTIGFTAPENQFAQHQPTFDAFEQSFHWKAHS